MHTTPPRLTWVKLESTFEGGGETNSFYAARLSHGWLVWNHQSHANTMAFVPDQPDAAGSVPIPEVP